MTLSSAMFVGFTGIKSNSVAVDTVGDNLANVNTTAFKGQRTLFETLLYRTISEGEGPSDTTGGTLPRQIGSGSGVAAIQRNHGQGGIESTGFESDLAIGGDGFFILPGSNGQQVYTRDGAFHLDATQTLVSTSGASLQVFAADSAGDIDRSTLSDLVIPLGTASEAVATTEVIMDGQLDAGSGVASAGAVVQSAPLLTAGGAAAMASTALTDLVDMNGLPLLADGDVLTINGRRGGIALSEAEFVVGTTGRTLGDFAGHLEEALGVNTDPTTGGTPGVTIGDGTAAPAGALVITSNLGEVNAINLDAASITNTTGVVTSPFSFATTTPAVGGDVLTTTFPVYDSLGNAVDVRLRAVMESQSETGTVWRFYAESEGDTSTTPVLGSGTITFDANGQFVGATGTDLQIDRDGVGAVTPLTFTLDLSGLTGLAGADGESMLIMASEDGAPAGIMVGYEIDADGIVTASFSNQQSRVLGQVALAKFANNEGLIALSENTFTVGPDSGAPTVLAPRTNAAGAIVSRALEQSNVEIAREFINLIAAQTGISSASRVVRVADDLLQELLLLAR